MSSWVSTPERIFIAGPYNPYNLQQKSHVEILLQTQRNVDDAMSIAAALIDKGHHVFVPHLYHYLQIHPECARDLGSYWYEVDNSYIDNWSTALYFIRSSPGADAERKRAAMLKQKIFTSLEEVPIVRRVS